jgi:hypothetical protein
VDAPEVERCGAARFGSSLAGEAAGVAGGVPAVSG